ncbi:MAG: mechanosensitive ion channel [Alphaproteobacteria bacterium]|nr:mechanosensitive ion channel [Alphaproteobacteria bacterium]
MEEELETLSRLVEMGTEFAVAYGFQILGALVFLVIGLKVAGWLGGRASQLCERKGVDITLSRFVGNVVKIVLVVFLIIITLGNFGVTIAPLIALAGATAFGATFALQGPLSNYGAGFAIILTRPFVVGNTILVKGVSGVVEEVALAATVLRGEDGETITVPNKEIVGEILVNSDASRIVESTLYVGADEDPLRIAELIRGVIQDATGSEDSPSPLVGIQDFAYGGIAIGVRYWAPSSKYFQTRYDTNARIKVALDEAGVKLLRAPWPELMTQTPGE